MGIIDWRMSECLAAGVQFRFNLLAEAGDVTALGPDVVIVATGGLAQGMPLAEGEALCVTAWDIIAGDVPPGQRALVFDDAGDMVALHAAEVIAAVGGAVEVMTPDRSFAPEVMGMNLSPWLKALQPLGVRLSVAQRLLGVSRSGNALRARIGTDYGPHEEVREVDQIVVNHGTAPLDELYLDLKPRSANRGAVDYTALLAGRAQPEAGTGFRLWRIGDAVASRNIHAAVHDALRLMRTV